MKNYKLIWHLWDGESPIPANATRYIDRNGHHHIPRFTIPFKHSGFGAGGEIVAYTLGETRERVECEGCLASRFKGLVYCGGYFEYRECQDCQGRGYIWRMGVAS